MKKEIKRWPYMLLGFIVFLCVGLIYSWSIFAPIIGTEFKSWTSASLALTFTISMSLFCVGNIAGGFITRKTSPNFTLMISAFLVCAGFIGTTLVQENSIWILYLFYGGICGFGVGLVYNVILSVMTLWFPDKVGTVSGALMMGFAMSTLVFGTSASYFIGIYGWRAVFIGLGVFTAIILSIASALIALPEGPAVLPQKKTEKNSGIGSNVDMTVGEMLKSRPFWMFILWGALMLISVYSLMGNAKQCALDIGASAPVATLSVAVIAVSNGLGRLLLGTAYDKLGRIRTMSLNSLLLLLSTIFVIIAFRTGSTSAMMVGFILTGFAYGGAPPSSSAFTVDFFGGNNYSVKFGIINLYILFGSLGSYIAGIIKTRTGTFETVFYVLIGLEAAAIIINLLISKDHLIYSREVKSIQSVTGTTADSSCM